ncbi:MAG TPA: SepM family pheromone-processing serine protease [Pseudogracilibacillus sp.]|nr:SepM family pheromone-processing serine protease [Pseudogracilibacillus sp.]
MKYSKKALISFGAIFIIMFIAVTYELPYYIYKPGSADSLDNMIEIEDGYQATGEMHLVTVSGGQATPLEFLKAKFSDFQEVVPLKEVRPEGISDEEYMEYQLHLMDNSQHASIAVAYEAAGKEVNLKNNGVYVVHVVEGMSAEDIVKPGDRITEVDGREIEESSEFVDYVKKKDEGEVLKLNIERDGETLNEEVEVSLFPDDPEEVGIGIQLVTNEEIEVDPPVNIKSGDIGGPSAGLMFSLEIYNQLTEKDITKGYNIAGTGAIDSDGNVERIGSIDKKVVAADEEGVEIFFAPNEQGVKGSNYREAKQAAEKVGTSMKIVPVDTFDDALEYLEKLQKHKG